MNAKDTLPGFLSHYLPFNEERFIFTDRALFRSAVIYNPQSLLEKFAETLVKQSEEAKTASDADTPKTAKKGSKRKTGNLDK